jgi:aryl-alcohol dehydrogenase-like predicted oxidoreductase
LPQNPGKIPRRPYKDGVNLSIIGFGGIVVVGMEQPRADWIVADSFERGVNYYDVAPSYGKGEAERKLGPALKPFRKRSFLACKTQERGAEGAGKELENSLKTLKTDYLDLYQLHAMRKMEDVDRVMGPGGAMETFVRAKKEGKVKYLGFSAHSTEAALALMDRFDFDSILFPVNYVCYAQGNFGPQVVAKAKEKGVARLALKSLAYTPWAKGEERTFPKCWYEPVGQITLARKALRFTLTEGVTAAIPPGDPIVYRMALDLASNLDPMGEEERSELLASSAELKPIFTT